MKYSQNELESYFDEGENLFMLTDDDMTKDDAGQINSPLGYMAIFVCLRGSIDFDTTSRKTYADEQHLQMFMTSSLNRIIRISEDYCSTGIIFSKKLWPESFMRVCPYNALSFIQPCVEMTPSDKQDILEILSTMRMLKGSGMNDNSLVQKSLIGGLFHKIGTMYERWASVLPDLPNTVTVVKFANLLIKNFKTHREVSFYADNLKISASRLSDILRKTTDLSASACIDKFTMLSVCSELSDPTKSIKEIAAEYHFHDTSHFCKFFRRFMQVSPDKFRKDSFRILR